MSTNQCDGCRAGIQIDENGNHRMGEPGGYPNLQSCEKGKYMATTVKMEVLQEVDEMATMYCPKPCGEVFVVDACTEENMEFNGKELIEKCPKCGAFNEK